MGNSRNYASLNTKPIGGGLAVDALDCLISADLLNVQNCLRFLVGDAKCPKCGEGVGQHQLERYWQGGRLRCPVCGKWHRATTGTALEGCSITSAHIIAIAILSAMESIKVGDIAKITGLGRETVRRWQAKIRDGEV